MINDSKSSQDLNDSQTTGPESTAVRVALWRALHIAIDPPPHVLEDDVGLKLAAPAEGWRDRPDMSPFTKPFRASILARARFIEDLVVAQAALGVGQYVILGAGLDTFAQRRPEVASHLLVFEVDRPGPQAWKRQRLIELGYGIPEWLRLVPVDFEAGDSWWGRLKTFGFDAGQRTVVASTGVSMYLTRDAIAATLRQVAALPSGSTFVMSFLLPIELADPEVRPGIERAAEGRERVVRPSSASSRQPTCSRWPAPPAFGTSSMFRQRRLHSATSRAGRMAYAHPIIQKSCW